MNDIQINTKIRIIQKEIIELNKKIDMLTSDLSKKISVSNLLITEKDINNKIKDLGLIINNIETKLIKINLPEDTKYYLESIEIESFRSNMKQLLAIMASFEQLYKNLVAYTLKNKK